MPEYVAAGSHGTFADASATLTAAARGDADPDVVRGGRLVNVHTGAILPGRGLVVTE